MKSFFLVVFFILTAQALCEASVSLQLELSSDTFRIGEVIECKVTVEYPGNYTLVPPLSFLPEKLEVREKTFKIPKRSKSRKKVKAILTYKITGFEPGEYVVDGFETKLQNTDDVKTIKGGIFKLKIVDLPSVEEDIRDIKPPLGVPNYSLPVILLLLISAGIYLSLRKKRLEEKKISEELKQLSPSEAALEKLNLLLSKNLLNEGKIKEFYTELSEILRSYLAQKYKIPVIERTTIELFQSLKGLVDKKYNLQTKEFLQSCDIVKFAKYIPTSNEIERDIQSLKELII